MPGERIERKLVRASVGQLHSLRLEIDRDLLVGGLSEHIEQHCVGKSGKRDGKKPGLDGVVAKDVGKAGTDHGAKPEIKQRPRRVLARRPAAEVVAGDKYRRTF